MAYKIYMKSIQLSKISFIFQNLTKNIAIIIFYDDILLFIISLLLLLFIIYDNGRISCSNLLFPYQSLNQDMSLIVVHLMKNISVFSQ
jgi:hypothetical protein